MARPAPMDATFDVGTRVRFMLAGQEILGTVVEQRGPLGIGGRQVVRLQLDSSWPVEPNETEAQVSDLEPRSMSSKERKALERLVKEAAPHRKRTLQTVFRLFQSTLRHVSMGLWPDQLAHEVAARDRQFVSVAEATAVLDELAALGVVTKRPSGLYISTDWLLKYLDETSRA